MHYTLKIPSNNVPILFHDCFEKYNEKFMIIVHLNGIHSQKMNLKKCKTAALPSYGILYMMRFGSLRTHVSGITLGRAIVP